jgi:uncharacterized protein (TIGR02757 family)
MSPIQHSSEIFETLERAYRTYATHNFVDSDPILIPKRFRLKEDIEIAGFLAATIAWGNRKSIINSANRMLEAMDNAPFDFVKNHQPTDRKRFAGFVHRTFSEVDAQYFMESLQHLYRNRQGLEGAFGLEPNTDVRTRISRFHDAFFEIEHLARTKKHVSNPAKGSSAKRLNMFLRWMVRSNKEGVDFGIWTNISPSQLMMPLDVHTGNVSRKMGLLLRKQDDWKAVNELTEVLRTYDSEDPIKYDFALFGLGAIG